MSDEILKKKRAQLMIGPTMRCSWVGGALVHDPKGGIVVSDNRYFFRDKAGDIWVIPPDAQVTAITEHGMRAGRKSYVRTQEPIGYATTGGRRGVKYAVPVIFLKGSGDA